MALKYHGKVEVPQEAIDHADTIKLENYRTNTPAKFQVRTLTGCDRLMERLAEIAGLPRKRLDFVFFSCCKGAEPHTDLLNPEKFENRTFVVPIILPAGRSVVFADGAWAEVQVGGVYEFDHTKTHSMTLEDTESGCVVVMVAVLRDQKDPAPRLPSKRAGDAGWEKAQGELLLVLQPAEQWGDDDSLRPDPSSLYGAVVLMEKLKPSQVRPPNSIYPCDASVYFEWWEDDQTCYRMIVEGADKGTLMVSREDGPTEFFEIEW